MKNLIVLATACVLFSSCASIFLPAKQKVTIVTNNPEATVYIDKEEFGKGSSITGRTKKDGAKQLVIKTPGYKDQYSSIVQTRRPLAFWLLQIPNPAWMFIYGFYWDFGFCTKCSSYEKVNEVKMENSKMVLKGASDKYIDISSIKLDIKNKKKDINEFYLDYSPTLYKDIEKAEKERSYEQEKAETKAAKKKKKKTLQDEEEVKIASDDSKFSFSIYKTLKMTGFVDTVNRVFADNNNSLLLEGSIKKVSVYTIYGKKYGAYKKARLFLTWYVKNTYGEVLDSVETSDYSGDFVFGSMFPANTYEKMYGDAIDNSYLNLHKRSELSKYIKQETNFSISDPSLTLPRPAAVVTDKSDAGGACVIVKNGRGHGSGFAITNDGYIVTNFHVISGRLKDKVSPIKVITSDGEELDAKVIRYNKFRDLALLKVERKFDKVFKTSNAKTFKNMQTVFTIGAPKSVELGQSISSGVISNERKNNNNNLLQLSMSVNAGNSGGPLFDETCNLQGVIVSKLVGQNTEGVSFAVPGYLLEEYLKINFK